MASLFLGRGRRGAPPEERVMLVVLGDVVLNQAFGQELLESA